MRHGTHFYMEEKTLEMRQIGNGCGVLGSFKPELEVTGKPASLLSSAWREPHRDAWGSKEKDTAEQDVTHGDSQPTSLPLSGAGLGQEESPSKDVSRMCALN